MINNNQSPITLASRDVKRSGVESLRATDDRHQVLHCRVHIHHIARQTPHQTVSLVSTPVGDRASSVDPILDPVQLASPLVRQDHHFQE